MARKNSESPRQSYDFEGAREDLGIPAGADVELEGDPDDDDQEQDEEYVEYGHPPDDEFSPTPTPPGDPATEDNKADTQTPPQWAQGLNQQVNALGGMVHQMYQSEAQRAAAAQAQARAEWIAANQPEATRPVWDNEFEPVARKVAELDQFQRAIARDMHETFKAREVERFGAAINELKTAYGDDFERLVPPANRENLLRNFLNDADRMDRQSLDLKYGFSRMGWKSQVETHFRGAHYDDLRKVKDTQDNDKKAATVRRQKSMSRIPAGGSNHQESRIQPTPFQRGYSDITRKAKAELEAQSGG